jgi:hypothetical protein
LISYASKLFGGISIHFRDLGSRMPLRSSEPPTTERRFEYDHELSSAPSSGTEHRTGNYRLHRVNDLNLLYDIFKMFAIGTDQSPMNACNALKLW